MGDDTMYLTLEANEPVVRIGDKVWVFNHLDTVTKIESRFGGKVIYFNRSEFGHDNFGLDG